MSPILILFSPRVLMLPKGWSSSNWDGEFEDCAGKARLWTMLPPHEYREAVPEYKSKRRNPKLDGF
jgi:hypothetical protein